MPVWLKVNLSVCTCVILFMCVVTKIGVHWDYPCNDHLADLLSVAFQEEKESMQFCGFLSSVYCILVTYVLHGKKSTIFGWIISRRMNKSMDSRKWNHWEDSTTLWWLNVLIQVWRADWSLVGSESAWSRKTRTSTEEQTCRRCRNAPRTSQPRISESRRWSQVFQIYFETPLHQRSSECVPLEILSVYPSKIRKYWDGQVHRQVLSAPEALKKCLDGHVTCVHHERRAKRKPVPRWRDPAELRKTKNKYYCSGSELTRDQRPWARHTGDQPWKAIPIQW